MLHAPVRLYLGRVAQVCTALGAAAPPASAPLPSAPPSPPSPALFAGPLGLAAPKVAQCGAAHAGGCVEGQSNGLGVIAAHGRLPGHSPGRDFSGVGSSMSRLAGEGRLGSGKWPSASARRANE
jgi:hypothetical protein